MIEIIFTINRVHRDFSGAEGVDADFHKVVVAERRTHGGNAFRWP